MAAAGPGKASDGLGARLWSWRYLILRRSIQFLILLTFFGTMHWGWKVAGSPLLTGNLSASELLGVIPLADPFATAQMLFTGFMPESRVLLGAATVLVLFALAGGRIFCSWVCPVNPVTDLAGWLGKRFVVGQSVRASRELRYWALGLALALSTLTGVAAFEWISPIAMLHRELIYGIGLGWIAVLGVFLFDLLVMRHGWCGHLCPLGAFYGLLGRSAQLRVRFDSSTCTHCGECAAVCPEPQVLNLSRAAEVGMIASGHCTNCGRCTPICPESSLAFDWRARIRGGELETSNRTARRPI
jgi:ferredoxin-type protein NapH